MKLETITIQQQRCYILQATYLFDGQIKFQSILTGKKKTSDGYEMNYKDLNPDQTKRMTHVISTLSIGPNNNYKHIHLNVLNLHAGLCPH